MLKIGNLVLKSNVFLGPMAGITDLSFRTVCREYNEGLQFSEMISSKALHYDDKKTYSLLKTDKSDFPFAIQIFGSDPLIMGEAAKKIEELNICDVIDINMGCPAPKIVNNNDGCALMKDLILSSKIIETVKKSVKIPVTVKFRAGWDFNSVNCVEFAKMCEQSGADAICLHPRTRTQYYSGNADWSLIKNAKENVSIPVIGNGDVKEHSDIERMIQSTSCDAVMISRGALGNPFIFSGIVPDNKTIIETAVKHLELIIKNKGEHIGILESRKHMCWYLKGMYKSGTIKNKINECNSFDEMKDILLSVI